MNPTPTNQATPDEMLTAFNGRSLKSIIIFTVVAHVILVLATSGPYIWRAVAGADSSKLSETERVELAVKEVNASMARIAEQHGIKPQDLGSRFVTNAPAPAAPPKAEPASPQEPVSEKPESTIEKELKKTEPGPTVPGAGDEDLFK